MPFAILNTLFPCFPCSNTEEITYPTEKSRLFFPDTSCDAAANIINVLRTTPLSGPALKLRLDAIVGTTGWTEVVAKWVLEKLCHLLEQEEEKLGPTVRDAYQRAWEVARGLENFMIEHPEFCTVIALGVLVSCPKLLRG